MTAEIVNLKTIRKRRARAEKDRLAEENRLRFGASKADRAAVAAERQANERAVDGAKRQPARLDEASDDLDPGSVS
jgi:hypothetical protein